MTQCINLFMICAILPIKFRVSFWASVPHTQCMLYQRYAILWFSCILKSDIIFDNYYLGQI